MRIVTVFFLYYVRGTEPRSLKNHIELTGSSFSEEEATDVAKAVTEQLRDLHESGFYRSGVNWETVTFRHPSDVAFTEATTVSPLDRSVMSLDLVSSTFAAKTALSRFVHKEYPKTDAGWFEKVVKWERSDEYIIDLIKKHSGLEWSPLTRVVIRNARIYERLVPGPSGHHYSFQEGRIPSSLKIMDSVDELFANVVLPRVPGTDRDWFIRVLVHAENEAHILKYMDQRRHIFDADDARDIILATRQLARYILKDMPVRRAFASVILLFVRIQVFGENRPDDTWFWDLMDGPKEALFYLSTVWGYSGDALNFAWDVMHGKSVCWNRLHAFFSKVYFENFAFFPHVYSQNLGADAPRATVIFLHGMRSFAEEQLRMMEKSGFHDALGPNVRIVAPQVEETDQNKYKEWFRFAHKPWDSKVANLSSREDLDMITAELVRLVDYEAESFGGDHSKIYIFGCSKGGMMALWLGLMGDRNFGGVVNQGGSFPILDIDEVSPAGRNVPVLHVHDPRDTVVRFPFAERGLASASAAGARGYTSITEVSIPGNWHHGFSRDSLETGAQWIRDFLN